MPIKQCLHPRKPTCLYSWKITYFSIGDIHGCFCHYVRFRGCKHSSDEKNKKHPANMILIMIKFSPPPPQSTTDCLPKKTHVFSFVGTEPPYFGIRVDETRAAGNNTSKTKRSVTVTPSGEGVIVLIRLSEDYLYIIYTYLYMVAPTHKKICVLYRTSGIYMCIYNISFHPFVVVSSLIPFRERKIEKTKTPWILKGPPGKKTLADLAL